MITVLLASGSPSLTIYFKIHPSPARADWFVVGLIVSVMLGLTGFLAYQTYINPLRDMRPFAEAILNTYAARIDALARSANPAAGFPPIAIRIAFLMLHRPWYWLFLRRYFRVEWDFQMGYAPDRNADFHCSKGVCGEALRAETEVLEDMTLRDDKGNKKTWKFQPKEIQKMPSFTCIYSWPVFQLNKQGRAGRVLGTLNLDSDTPHAYDRIVKDPAFKTEMKDLRDLFCKLVS